jgi:hypothetical protein
MIDIRVFNLLSFPFLFYFFALKRGISWKEKNHCTLFAFTLFIAKKCNE